MPYLPEPSRRLYTLPPSTSQISNVVNATPTTDHKQMATSSNGLSPSCDSIGSATIFAVSLDGRGFPSLPHPLSGRALARLLSDTSAVECDVGHTVGLFLERRGEWPAMTSLEMRANRVALGAISPPLRSRRCAEQEGVLASLSTHTVHRGDNR